MEHTFLIDNYVLVLERKKENKILKRNAQNFLPTQYKYMIIIKVFSPAIPINVMIVFKSEFLTIQYFQKSFSKNCFIYLVNRLNFIN